MASPLVSEMSTALRKSATTLEIISEDIVDNPRKILFLNKSMAEEMETSRVDGQITSIMCDIIQYNKETGWGKVRLDEYLNPLNFNVPSDMKSVLQHHLLSAMGKQKVYIQTYFVRDKFMEPIRLIVVGILPDPERTLFE